MRQRARERRGFELVERVRNGDDPMDFEGKGRGQSRG